MGGWTLEDDSYLEYTTPIFVFLAVHSVLTGAMASAGFGLAMADMVLERKLVKAKQLRYSLREAHPQHVEGHVLTAWKKHGED